MDEEQFMFYTVMVVAFSVFAAASSAAVGFLVGPGFGFAAFSAFVLVFMAAVAVSYSRDSGK